MSDATGDVDYFLASTYSSLNVHDTAIAVMGLLALE